MASTRSKSGPKSPATKVELKYSDGTVAKPGDIVIATNIPNNYYVCVEEYNPSGASGVTFIRYGAPYAEHGTTTVNWNNPTYATSLRKVGEMPNMFEVLKNTCKNV